MVLSSWPSSHCKNSPGSHDECRTVPDGGQPLDQADGEKDLDFSQFHQKQTSAYVTSRLLTHQMSALHVINQHCQAMGNYNGYQYEQTKCRSHVKDSATNLASVSLSDEESLGDLTDASAVFLLASNFSSCTHQIREDTSVTGWELKSVKCGLLHLISCRFYG